MFGLLGDADASTDSATSELMSTIANNITDAVSQAASSASEFFPDLVHGSLRALQNNDDGSGSGSGSDSSGGGLSSGQIGAIVGVVIFFGCCAGLIGWCKAKLCGDTNLSEIGVSNPLQRAREEEQRKQQAGMKSWYEMRVKTWGA